MSLTYSPGSINTGIPIGALTVSGNATNGSTTLGTVGVGKKWIVIAAQLTAEHDNLGLAGTATIGVASNTALTLRTAVNQGPITVQQTYPVGYGLIATAGQTITVVSPSTDIRAEANVTYIEVGA